MWICYRKNYKRCSGTFVIRWHKPVKPLLPCGIPNLKCYMPIVNGRIFKKKIRSNRLDILITENTVRVLVRKRGFPNFCVSYNNHFREELFHLDYPGSKRYEDPVSVILCKSTEYFSCTHKNHSWLIDPNLEIIPAKRCFYI